MISNSEEKGLFPLLKKDEKPAKQKKLVKTRNGDPLYLDHAST